MGADRADGKKLLAAPGQQRGLARQHGRPACRRLEDRRTLLLAASPGRLAVAESEVMRGLPRTVIFRRPSNVCDATPAFPIDARQARWFHKSYKLYAGTISVLLLRSAFITSAPRPKCASTSSGGVNAIHWWRDTSV